VRAARGTGRAGQAHEDDGRAGLSARTLGADALDREALERAVRAFSPDLVMHQLTDLPDDAMLGAGGGVVRFGQFSGPGTSYESELPDPPRIHIDAAARRAFEAMDCEGVVIAVDKP
jgi:hypothetical protein